MRNELHQMPPLHPSPRLENTSRHRAPARRAGEKSKAGTWWPFRQPRGSPRDLPRITAPQAPSAISPAPHVSWWSRSRELETGLRGDPRLSHTAGSLRTRKGCRRPSARHPGAQTEGPHLQNQATAAKGRRRPRATGKGRQVENTCARESSPTRINGRRGEAEPDTSR